MKKQLETVTKTLNRPGAGRIEWILLVIIAGIFYRSQGNRRMSISMPPNTLGFAKQTLQSVVSEGEKLVGKLAKFFYNFTSESFMLFQLLAITTLVALLVIAIVHIVRTN